MRRIVAILLSTFPLSLQPMAIGAGTLSGRVLEKGTRAPVVGASVLLTQVLPEGAAGEPALHSADVDARGAYSLAVPDGTYQAVVAAPGFGKAVLPALVLAGDVARDHYLVREGFELPEVVVTAKRLPKTAVSRQVVSRDELVKVPGSANDVLRALETLPGVATAGDFSGVLLVRGGGPNDNQYYLDRIPYAFPYHFGGVISTLNSEMIRSVDFSAGGFGPEYGNCWGGIVDVTQRDPRDDRWGVRADVNLLLTDLLVEGPVSDRSSLSLSGRRSYLELLGGFFDDFTAIPSFGDYQAKWTYRHSASTLWDFQAFGSDDQLGLVIKEDSEAAKKDPALAGEFKFHNSYHSQGANLRRLMDENDTLLVTPFHYDFGFETELGRDLYFNFGLENAGVRTDWLHSFGEGRDLRVGTELDRFRVTIGAYFPRPPSEGSGAEDFDLTTSERLRSDLSRGFNMATVYAEQSWRFWDRLQVSGGLRYDRLEYNHTQDVSPRTGVSYDLDERTVLKGSWGLYHQITAGPELDPVFGNPDVRTNRSNTVVLGAEREIADSLQLRVEGYDKELSRIVVPDPVLKYSNKGRGYTNGVEVFVRRLPSERLFGWVSYAKSVSRRQDDPAGPWRWYDYDQPHIGTVVASYRLTPKWTTGLKWRYASGQPETPVVGSYYDPVYDRYRPVYGEVNSVRKPVYHRLDLSVSREARYNTWRLRWYLEVLNVYNSKNVIGYDYNEDYSERTEITQIPFLPYVGLEAKF
jgi:hypothetical protein